MKNFPVENETENIEPEESSTLQAKDFETALRVMESMIPPEKLKSFEENRTSYWSGSIYDKNLYLLWKSIKSSGTHVVTDEDLEELLGDNEMVEIQVEANVTNGELISKPNF